MFSLAWVIHEIATGERLLRRGQGRPLRCEQAPLLAHCTWCFKADAAT